MIKKFVVGLQKAHNSEYFEKEYTNEATVKRLISGVWRAEKVWEVTVYAVREDGTSVSVYNSYRGEVHKTWDLTEAQNDTFDTVNDTKKDTLDTREDTFDTKQDNFVKHFGVYTPAIYHFEMAGMEVAYDSSEPCEWFGGRNYGLNRSSLKTGFHEVMYFIGRKTTNGRLIYRTRDCYTGSFTVGAGNNAKAWRVDRRKPKQVFSVLEKIKAWLTKHGELAA